MTRPLAALLGLCMAIRPTIARATPQADTLTTAYDVSGLRVIQRINRATNIVAARLYLLGGTRQLTVGTAGVEALLLYASEYGTERYPGDEARRAMARTGSVVTLDVGADWSVLGFTGLALDFDSAWTALADRIARPALSAQAIAQARGRLLTRANIRYTDPDQRLHVLAARAMFPNHPYEIDPEGTDTSLSSITPEKLQAYAREQLVTSRMLVVLVGNVERAHAESLIATTLGQLPHGTYHWTLPPPAPKVRPRWLIEDRRIATNYMLGYFTGPPATDRGYWAFRVATALLSSQLHYRVRTQRGLSYAAYAPFLDRAIPIGGAYVSTPRPGEVIAIIRESMRTLQQQELDYFSLARFLDTYAFDYLSENSTAMDQADFLARAELYLGGFRRGDEFVKRMRSVSAHDVVMAALKYMSTVQYAYLGDPLLMRDSW